MHHADDEEQREVEHLHAAAFTLECAERKNSVMKPNEQAKEDDSQPVNIVSSHVFLSQKLGFIVLSTNKSIRISFKGVSDYPSNSEKRLEGVAVGLFVRYPLLTSPTEGYVRSYASYRVLVERQSIGSIKN